MPSTAPRPDGDDFLVIGHEGFGRVEEVGPTCRAQAGRLRRRHGAPPRREHLRPHRHVDMTTDDVYYERGINLRHGYLTEYYVDDAEFIVKLPRGLDVGVLLEPLTVVEKGIARPTRSSGAAGWQPRRPSWAPAHRPARRPGSPAARHRGHGFGRRQAVSEHRSDRGDRRPLRLDRRYPVPDAAPRYGPSTSSSRPLALPASSSTACRRWVRTASWSSPSVTGGDREVEVPADDQSRLRARK